MGVHSELFRVMEEYFGPVGINWSNGVQNATAGSASISAQRLQELIQKAGQCGYETRISSGTLTMAPKP